MARPDWVIATWLMGTFTIVSLGCEQSAPPAPVVREAVKPAPWATILEWKPDPSVITDANWRDAIEETRMPWRVRHDASGIELLLMPPGTFVMGMSPGDEHAVDHERPAHRVVISKPFYLGRYEVTEQEWRKVMPESSTAIQASLNRTRTAQIDAQLAAGLTREEAEQRVGPAVQILDMYADHPVTDMRAATFEFLELTALELPTEAQWEYACRAGVRAPQYGPVDEVTHSDGQLHQVGQRLPNALGLYDMLGNALEPCRDTFGDGEYEYRRDGAVDPVARGLESPQRTGPKMLIPTPIFSMTPSEREQFRLTAVAEAKRRGISYEELERRRRNWGELAERRRVVRGGTAEPHSQRASWRRGARIDGMNYPAVEPMGLRVSRSLDGLSIDADILLFTPPEGSASP